VVGFAYLWISAFAEMTVYVRMAIVEKRQL